MAKRVAQKSNHQLSKPNKPKQQTVKCDECAYVASTEYLLKKHRDVWHQQTVTIRYTLITFDSDLEKYLRYHWIYLLSRDEGRFNLPCSCEISSHNKDIALVRDHGARCKAITVLSQPQVIQLVTPRDGHEDEVLWMNKSNNGRGSVRLKVLYKAKKAVAVRQTQQDNLDKARADAAMALKPPKEVRLKPILSDFYSSRSTTPYIQFWEILKLLCFLLH
jgi:hypothetical protein